MKKMDRVTRNFRVACTGLIALGVISFAIGMFLR